MASWGDLTGLPRFKLVLMSVPCGMRSGAQRDCLLGCTVANMPILFVQSPSLFGIFSGWRIQSVFLLGVSVLLQTTTACP